MAPKRKTYSPEVQALLKSIITDFENEEKTVRQRQILTWRKLKLMWENLRSTYYSDVAHDWRIPDTVRDEGNDQAYYDKPINVFRAYLESIIAALSVTVPAIKCYPDDAEDPLDILTARAGDQIGKLIYRHNDVPLKWLHALFVYCTEGMVACYNYSEDKKEYGTFVDKIYEDQLEEHIIESCPMCGYEMDDIKIESPDMIPTEGNTGEPDICPSCGQVVVPVIQNTTVSISKLIKEETRNKTRQCLDICGGLYVRVPNWARNQKECLYLDYEYETHFANALEKWPHLYGEIDCGVYEPFEVWGRLSPQYVNEFPRNNVTCRHWWLRPAAFNTCKEDEMKQLKKLFPKGVCVSLVNDTFAEAYPCGLDDEWTLTYNPMSDYVHADPIGMLLISVQEITNDLISLELQTIEHGIGQTFADPTVLNFNAYRLMETLPGGIYPATPKAGKSLQEGFLELKTATLSQEVQPFGQNIQQLGQLASGAQPAIFGGALEENKTASGYAQSRAQSLQRLQNTWKIFTSWWKVIFSKAIPKYIESVQYDERDVQKTAQGGFINVMIRRAELEGRIGRFELEANENLPITWNQKKDTILQLMTLQDPNILAMLGSPENLPLIREAIGLDDFVIPGETDRNKQFEEIQLLMQSVPIPMGMGPMGPIEGPSVDVDPQIDNHSIEFDICRYWLTSDAGRLAKIENSEGYRNVLLHAKMHLMFIQQNMMAQTQEDGSNPEKPNEDTNEPIKEESDVNVQS